jgi:hypothetical protein
MSSSAPFGSAENGAAEGEMIMPRKKTAANGSKRIRKPYAKRAREYQKLMDQLGLNQLECGRLFDYSGRTSRRFKRGDAKVPLMALMLLRLMADGALTKQQIIEAR